MATFTTLTTTFPNVEPLRKNINLILRTMSLKTLIPRMSQHFNTQEFIELVSEFHDPCHFKDKYSESFLGACVNEEHYDLLEYLLTIKTIEPNIQNKNGISPLMLACIQKKEVAVTMLLNHERTDPNIKTINHESPLEKAITVGYIPNVELLLSDPRININIRFSEYQLFGYSHLLTHVIDLLFMVSEPSLYSSWSNIIQMMLENPKIQYVSTSDDIYILNEKGKDDPKFKGNQNLLVLLTDFINNSKKEMSRVDSRTVKITTARKVLKSSLVVVPIIDNDENDDNINWDEPD